MDGNTKEYIKRELYGYVIEWKFNYTEHFDLLRKDGTPWIVTYQQLDWRIYSTNKVYDIRKVDLVIKDLNDYHNVLNNHNAEFRKVALYKHVLIDDNK